MNHHCIVKTAADSLGGRTTSRFRSALPVTAAALLIGSLTLGVDLRRQSIDGGGTMFSSNGDFELSGTIGQPDAAALSGGDFTVHGGFWFSSPPADCDADGGVNLGDFPLLNTCLAGPFGGFELVECRCYDFDGDKDVDIADVGRFAAQFDGG